jgi:hypothetical protein
MASTHQAAAKRKVKKSYKGKYPGPDKYKGKKPFKGKYPGPDKYKGKPPPKKAAAKPAPKKAAAAAPKPVSPNLPTNTGVAVDSNGNLKLQTNYEIERMKLDAEEEAIAATEEGTALNNESLINETASKTEAQNVDINNRTKAAGRMAARGMRGSAAMASQANVKEAYGSSLNQIGLRRQQEKQTSDNMITSAAARRARKMADIAVMEKDWTDQQSKNNPTVGSTPVNSGVVPTKATAVATRPAAKKAAAKAKPKAFKGKYPGPDKFKGKKPFKGKRPGPG